MSLSINNRIYGLVIGGVIGDLMGALVTYSPNTIIKKPSDSNKINIKVGYWTEPTLIWFNNLDKDNQLEPSTGVFCDNNIKRYPLLAKIFQVTVFTLKHPKDFKHQLISSYELGSNSMESDICKLWCAIIDIVMHGGHKKTVLNIDSYKNIEGYKDIFPNNHYVDDNNKDFFEVQCLRDILQIFKNTNSFTEGLDSILNNSPAPCWCGPIYGHLAGAYYGITDIPEEWMDNIHSSDILLKKINNVLQNFA